MQRDINSNYKKILQATLFVAISAILYGFLGFLGIGVLRENVDIATMLFWRFFIAGGWILLFIIKKHSTGGILHRIDKRSILFMLSLGAIGYAGASQFYFIASQYTGTGLAMVIFFSYPIIVACVSWVINPKHFNLRTVLLLVIMSIGLMLLKDSHVNQFNSIGIFFAIIAATCYAFYVIGSKHICSIHMDSYLLTMMVCFGCAVIFLIVSISTHRFIFPNSMKSWAYLLALGIIATALPIQLMLEGLKYISSMRASIISVIEPLVTILVGILLLNESVTHLQFLGAFIVILSALLVQFQSNL